MKDNIITLQEVTKVYDLNGPKPFMAIDQLNLKIDAGDFICIMGPSGSGKSTLINLISTIDYPTSGEVIINGKRSTDLDEAALSQFRQTELGYIFQEHQLIDSITLFENIIIKHPVSQKKKMIEQIHHLAKILDIDQVLYHYPRECSSGQNQRASILRALLDQPRIIVADEPTGNLDSVNTRQLLDQFTMINKQGTTILMVTHDPLCASYANKVYYLVDGRFQHIYNREELTNDEFYKLLFNAIVPDMEALL